MKVTFDIDCTPEEARRFLGWPDVTPVHDVMVDQMKQVAAQALPHLDPESMAKLWFPMGSDMLQEFQQGLWAAATGATTGSDKTDKKTG